MELLLDRLSWKKKKGPTLLSIDNWLNRVLNSTDLLISVNQFEDCHIDKLINEIL